MEKDTIMSNIEDLLTKKYEPILVIKMMRLPTIQEMEGFRLYIKNNFGYNSLIFPGEMETDVKLVSVLDTEKIKIEDLQQKMNDLISTLENEASLPQN
jgi:hypothetical protein